MDEEITIIDTRTRNEKIKIFITNNKKKILSILILLTLLICSFYIFQSYKNSQKEILSDKYNSAVIEYKDNDTEKSKTANFMKEIVNTKDSTYSPLALYFLIDNNLVENRSETNNLFDVVINKTPLENEIKNLIIYKKALFNADFANETELLNILNPLVNSTSVWRSHALHLIGEYFYFNDEKLKAKDFFNEILKIDNANQDIIKEAKKRLSRDLSE